MLFAVLLVPVFSPQNWPNGEEVLEEWTKKVAEEHKSHWYSQQDCVLFVHQSSCEQWDCLFLMLSLSVLYSRMQAAEAELLYIKEVEKLDGFGQESFPAKVEK